MRAAAPQPLLESMGCLLLLLLLLLVLGPCQGPAAARIPSWTAPPFDKSAPVSKTAAYGLPVAQHTTAIKVYNATMDWTGGFGVYSHAPMIAFHGGFFIASWKNGVLQEDEPGQRVLWSYASVDAPLNYSAPTILFPNVSSADQPCSSSKNLPPFPTHPPYLSPGCAHLFAEPTVVINDRVYVAASLRQFCLWPLDPLNENGVYLLLRRVTLAPGVAPELGPVFWAADPGSAWTATNQRLAIRTLDQMDTETQGDIAELLAGERPCAANATKCEYCAGGCQSLRAVGNRSASCTVMDFGGPWIERTRWAVPGNDDTDILVYRAEGQYLCFSQRSEGAAGEWSLPSETKLTDIHSNFNAGTLPDGRVYLLHNPIIGAPHLRDPLVLSLSSDGYAFSKAYVAMSCLLPPVSSHEHPEGCKRRNPGGGSPGPQYSQGLVNGESLYVIMSMNKEDIWVEQIPLSSLATATTALKTDDRDTSTRLAEGKPPLLPPPLPPGCPAGAAEAVAGTGLLPVTLLGAKGDGWSDDLAAIQGAVECVYNLGGVVFFPPGFYFINGTLVLRERLDNGTSSTGIGVVLQGSNSPTSGKTATGRAGGSIVTGSFHPQTRLSNCGGAMTVAQCSESPPVIQIGAFNKKVLEVGGKGTRLRDLSVVGGQTGILVLSSANIVFQNVGVEAKFNTSSPDNAAMVITDVFSLYFHGCSFVNPTKSAGAKPSLILRGQDTQPSSTDPRPVHPITKTIWNMRFVACGWWYGGTQWQQLSNDSSQFGAVMLFESSLMEDSATPVSDVALIR